MKTLALIDLIGIKNRFTDGSAASKLQEFWNLADAWTNSQSIEPCPLEDDSRTLIAPQAIVTAWSDSLLLYSDPEIQLVDFYEKMLFPLKAIAERVDKAYAVVCRGEALDAPEHPALGGRLMRQGGGNAWTQVYGSGPAWMHLWQADKLVTRKTDWHDSYSLYAVGKQSLYPKLEVKDAAQMPVMGGTSIPVQAVVRRPG